MNIIVSKSLIIIALLNLLPLFGQADANNDKKKIKVEEMDFPLHLFRDEILPIVFITTEAGEMPTVDKVLPPEGCVGVGSTNKTKVNGRMVMELAGDTIFDSGDFVDGIAGMKVSIRGNTSAFFEKRPYKVKLQQKADLLQRGNDDYYAEKEWLLLTDEVNLIKNFVGRAVSSLIGMPYTPGFRYVNLIFNGRYCGIYILSESVGMEKNRVGVNKKRGFLFEYDAYWWNEPLYLSSTYFLNYTFKHPDVEEFDSDKIEYMQQLLTDMETSFEVGGYDSLIDVKSFARWMLAHDILGSGDGLGTNVYLAKYDSSDTTKVTMPCLWDFDSAFRTPNDWASQHITSNFWMTTLFGSLDKTFTLAYKQLWEEKKDTLFASIDSLLANFSTSLLAYSLTRYELLDFHLWHYSDHSYMKKQIKEARQWFSERKEWMEYAVSRLSIGDVANAEKGTVFRGDESTRTYNLKGIQIDDATAGWIIRGGKLYLQ